MAVQLVRARAPAGEQQLLLAEARAPGQPRLRVGSLLQLLLLMVLLLLARVALAPPPPLQLTALELMLVRLPYLPLRQEGFGQ